MKTKEIIERLDWFYTLEVEQIDLYERQSAHVKDEYVKKVLLHLAQTEKIHEKKIREKIQDFGGQPKKKLTAVLEYMGGVGGTVTSMIGIIPLLNANVLLELNAQYHYNKFIKDLEKTSLAEEEIKDLIRVLEANSIEEEMHSLWCKGYAQQLKDKGEN